MKLKQFKKKLTNQLFFLNEEEIRDIINHYEILILKQIDEGSIEEIVLQQYDIKQIANQIYFELPTKRKVELTVNKKRSAMQIFGEIIGVPWAILIAAPFWVLFIFSCFIVAIFIYITGGIWFVVRYLICFIIKVFNPKSVTADKIKQTNFFLFPWVGKITFKKRGEKYDN